MEKSYLVNLEQIVMIINRSSYTNFKIFKKIDFFKYIHNKTQAEKNNTYVKNNFYKLLGKIFIY